ncbi:hypothetical protein PINS_up004379 [Pythium insidiosum]|nr:hypothetical protein PINS_up004379 [Pythium insidiosum]
MNEFPRLKVSDVDDALQLRICVDACDIPTTKRCWCDWELIHPNLLNPVGFNSVQVFPKQDWASISVTFVNLPVIPKLRECSLRVSVHKSTSRVFRLLGRAPS